MYLPPSRLQLWLLVFQKCDYSDPHLIFGTCPYLGMAGFRVLMGTFLCPVVFCKDTSLIDCIDSRTCFCIFVRLALTISMYSEAVCFPSLLLVVYLHLLGSNASLLNPTWTPAMKVTELMLIQGTLLSTQGATTLRVFDQRLTFSPLADRDDYSSKYGLHPFCIHLQFAAAHSLSQLLLSKGYVWNLMTKLTLRTFYILFYKFSSVYHSNHKKVERKGKCSTVCWKHDINTATLWLTYCWK